MTDGSREDVTSPLEWKDPDYRPESIARTNLTFSISEVPPIWLTILLGFQHYITLFGPTLAIPIVLSKAICMDHDQVAVAELMGTIFFVSGAATLLQTTIGCRLPIVQGGTFTFLIPAFAIIKKFGDCPAPLHENATAVEMEETTEQWQIRLREIQGAILLGSIFQIVLGFTGLVGVFIRFIGPLTISVTIAMIGISLFGVASDMAGLHWGIACCTMAMLTLFSQYIHEWRVPFPAYSRDEGFHLKWLKVLQIFPVSLTIVFSWLLCFIITVSGGFPDDPGSYGYHARTDIRSSVLQDSKWFRLPYPCQWGTPTFSVAATTSMLSGFIACIIESIGDYYACARISGAPPPPMHAINRGIGIEGIGCLICGLFGSGDGTTSYSENVAAIGITKVGSLRVVQMCGVIMLILGCFSKLGALFVTIPDPIVGGILCIMFGMISAIGLSNLQYVDLQSTRNLFILGFSMLIGLIFPHWLNSNEGIIDTGIEEIDQILTVLLSTAMFISGVTCFILDNTMPGTKEERGILKWNAIDQTDVEDGSELSCYDLPFGMDVIRRSKFMRYVPFSPTFTRYPSIRRRASSRPPQTDKDSTDKMPSLEEI